MNENSDDFYCVLGDRIKGHSHLCGGICTDCPLKHRKYPTPSQYKEEYGEDVPDTMPVWVICCGEENNTFWEVHQYGGIRFCERSAGKKAIIVVAYTPFPKPDNDWRPEKTTEEAFIAGKKT